jgi:hypothetical protein
MTATVFVDAAGGTVGGAGRFRAELYKCLASTGREDVRLIGPDAYFSWLLGSPK